MKLQFNDIALAVQGETVGKDVGVTGVSIDTRTLVAGELYIALKGKNFDGHAFIDKAEQNGAVAVMVERKCETRLPQIVVRNNRLALAELAGYWRRQLDVKIIGITGSNGKTTVKEMIAAILATKDKTLFTQGNLNNDIGVPLTLLKLNDKHRYAVIEMGANHSGEIAYTSHYAQADVSVITNVGVAHIEGFGDIDCVARSKGEIIESLGISGVAVLNRDDAYYDYWKRLAGGRKSVSFGFNETADVFAENISTVLTGEGFKTRFNLKTSTANFPVQLLLAGNHNVKNALAAAAATLQFGIELQYIKQGLEQLKPIASRMQPLLGRMGTILIDDTYNANPDSLKAALDVLNSNDNNWVILGAFGELGDDSPAIHREIGKLIKSKPVQRLFAIGNLAEQTVEAFGIGGQFFENQQQLIVALNLAITGRETILVKGSRSQKMENVVAAMVENSRAA